VEIEKKLQNFVDIAEFFDKMQNAYCHFFIYISGYYFVNEGEI
jgi:hypothetical protein